MTPQRSRKFKYMYDGTMYGTILMVVYHVSELPLDLDLIQ